MLDNTSNQPSKFRIKNWVEINDDSHEKNDTCNLTRYKTSMIRSSLHDYSDAYIHLKETVTIPSTAATGTAANNVNKKVIFRICAPFTNCISEINNTQVDDAQDIDVVMPMYNLIEYSDICLKTCLK